MQPKRSPRIVASSRGGITIETAAPLRRNGSCDLILQRDEHRMPVAARVMRLSRARAVVSGDTFPERTPHPRGLLHAAQVMGVNPAECVYVGDAERDAQAAKAAGMYSLIAGFGYIGDDDKADSWYQHGWLDTPLDLLAWLDKPRQLRVNGGAA